MKEKEKRRTRRCFPRVGRDEYVCAKVCRLVQCEACVLSQRLRRAMLLVVVDSMKTQISTHVKRAKRACCTTALERNVLPVFFFPLSVTASLHVIVSKTMQFGSTVFFFFGCLVVCLCESRQRRSQLHRSTLHQRHIHTQKGEEKASSATLVRHLLRPSGGCICKINVALIRSNA